MSERKAKMTLTHDERDRMIEQYATGAERLRAAVVAAPADALKWRPAAGEFSVHEIAVHCADSETNAAGRIRYVLGSDNAPIIGYDPMAWSQALNYHSHPLEAALAAVAAVRANTVPILQGLADEAWGRAATHSESGLYTAAHWLRIYSEHVEEHIAQIGEVLAAWHARA
jgi:hypothetical protein